MQKRWVRLALALAVAMATGAAHALSPPMPAQRPHAVVSPAGTRIDEFYWLRDDTRSNPDVLAHLKAENAYADAVLAPTRPLQETLYKELVGRLQPDDVSVPTRERGYWYYTRFEADGEYPILARRKGSVSAREEVLLDQNAMAAGKAFFQIGASVVSQDNRLIAWAEDTVGRRQYVLRVKDLATGQMLADRVENVEPDLVWANDNRTLVYIEKDPVTLLSRRVKAHVLGTPASADRVLYEEADASFYISLMRTKSDRFLCIGLTSTEAAEQRCAPALSPRAFAVLEPRRKGHLYSADHVAGRWVIRTNWDAPNYRLMVLADAQRVGDRRRWRELVAQRPDVFIQDFAAFDGFIAIEERAGGVKRLQILRPDGGSSPVVADEPAYAMGLAHNPEPNTTRLRYTYTSLVTPSRIYELDVTTGQRTLLKETPVLGYDRSRYASERVWARARDGALVPVSLVYAKGFKRDGTAALLQYGYGSYGSSSDPVFSPAVISLLDRGVVYAIAHVRGGQEMGRAWYDAGRLMHKANSFTDFVDVTRSLVAQNYAARDRVAAQGASAGGLLMGAVANMAPGDYRAIVAQVPFVDVVTTMLDETIPLTTNEFDEWGDPKDARAYAYMLSYSPYDNVGRHAYPALYVRTGLWDSQVQYYEPAKWVARLRERKTDDRPVVFRVEMEAGHGGTTGRFRKFRETAEVYAFVLDQLGVSAAPSQGTRSATETRSGVISQR
jgi:oligopeptidase B